MHKIDEKIWLYAEKLYVKCCGINQFVELCRRYKILMDNADYTEVDLASFYDSENYSRFVVMMLTENAKKDIPLMQEIIFEVRVQRLKDQDADVEHWYNEIVGILKDENIIIDNKNQKLERASSIPLDESFFGYKFDNLFIDNVVKSSPDFCVNLI